MDNAYALPTACAFAHMRTAFDRSTNQRKSGRLFAWLTSHCHTARRQSAVTECDTNQAVKCEGAWDNIREAAVQRDRPFASKRAAHTAGQFRSYAAGRFRVSRLVMLTPAVAWR